jgi:undecaprenyl diphosphate synthase
MQLQLSEHASGIYSAKQLQNLDRTRIPAHLAIIPDGNRRWAKKQNVSVLQGHQTGADNLLEIVKAAKELGIKAVTFYAFSTENWLRDALEIRALMWLLESYLIQKRPVMLEHEVRFHGIGDRSRFSQAVQKALKETESITSSCTGIDMIMALNYGGRDELRRAMTGMLTDYEKQVFSKEDVTENLISRYLDTAKWPDPDLLIRTSGEKRISNFLLWQLSYSEIFISDILWPDFDSEQLLEAILNFQQRQRRLGGA